jgi:hypothetical protein
MLITASLHFSFFSLSVRFFSIWLRFSCFPALPNFRFCGVFRFWKRFLPFLHAQKKHFSRKGPSEDGISSPDSSGNPFYGGVRHEKIGADSGK